MLPFDFFKKYIKIMYIKKELASSVYVHKSIVKESLFFKVQANVPKPPNPSPICHSFTNRSFICNNVAFLRLKIGYQIWFIKTET